MLNRIGLFGRVLVPVHVLPASYVPFVYSLGGDNDDENGGGYIRFTQILYMNKFVASTHA